jgi:glutamate-5-semialdehyde dehydrogenase
MTSVPACFANVSDLARGARAAALLLADLPNELRVKALLSAAEAIEAHASDILAANAQDCATARKAVEQGAMSAALFKRLQTSERGVAQMAAHVREVAALEDPLGRELAVTALDEDLTLYKTSCPLGVIAVIFEARPDVVPQVASLALRSGNALLLKGGSEAEHTNTALVNIWRNAIAAFHEIPAESIGLLHTREDINQLLSMDEYVDLIIPRGSYEFVRYIFQHSRIPVLGHGAGVCHVYVDRAANLEQAVAVAFDSKVQYPAACNSAETLLVHQAIASAFLPPMLARFEAAGVLVRGCPRTVACSAPNTRMVPAEESDWGAEYSDLVIAIKIVDSLDEAIRHINRYGSKHTEAIVTEDASAAAAFMQRVDAAGVYQNASTRFADGFRYGLGAEVGISTGKLHARGPVGVEGLTSYKYRLVGRGHTVASYASGQRSFKHHRLK